MNTAAQITLGVPVFQGARFLPEALQSLQAQTYRDFRVIISIDGPDAASVEACQPFLRDPRFSLVQQPRRLGWVGNINWLMEQVETSFWCYYQQDDVVDPRYLEVLLSAAWTMPEAAVVYCDMVAFGTQSWRLEQTSVTGNPVNRQMTLLTSHHSAVAFRGLTRLEALRESKGVPVNEMENFSCDTAWMSAVACWGDLRRVPGYLYLKRYHETNTHLKWQTWEPQRRTDAWMIHCADMLEQALRVRAAASERRLLWLATVNRLVSGRVASGYIEIKTLTPETRLKLLGDFLYYLEQVRKVDLPRWLESTWQDLAGGAGDFLRAATRARKRFKAAALRGASWQASRSRNSPPAGPC